MTCATISNDFSRTALPKPGHGRTIGLDRPRLVLSPRARQHSDLGTRSSAGIVNPQVARQTANAKHMAFVEPHKADFYANCECDRLPGALRDATARDARARVGRG